MMNEAVAITNFTEIAAVRTEYEITYESADATAAVAEEIVAVAIAEEGTTPSPKVLSHGLLPLRWRWPFPRAIEELGEQADECDELKGALGIILDELVSSRVTEAGHSAREHHHEALLLVDVGLVSQFIEPQDRRFRREHTLHELGAVELLSAPHSNKVIQSYDGIKDGLCVVAIPI